MFFNEDDRLAKLNLLQLLIFRSAARACFLHTIDSLLTWTRIDSIPPPSDDARMTPPQNVYLVTFFPTKTTSPLERSLNGAGILTGQV